MPCVVGVDGCRAGWLAVVVRYEGTIVDEEVHLCPAFSGVLSLPVRPAVVAVDVPIGLLDEVREGGRDCDRLLRQVLGSPRSSSVFSPPVRPALDCSSFEEARRWRLNRQSFGILPRVREVDELVTPSLQRFVQEVHPELSFFALNGLKPVAESKVKPPGREKRAALLRGHFFQVEEHLGRLRRVDAGMDDLLDAYAAAWTALRILRGEAGRIPEDPPVDAKGLRMEIRY